MPHRDAAPVIVGVTPGQADAVVVEAAVLAERFEGELVCATVDTGYYMVTEFDDGSVTASPVDPDNPEIVTLTVDPALLAHLTRLLDGRGVRWSTRALAGDPARALDRLADTLDAGLIVVGTRHAGWRGSLHEFFSGSVGVNLAHRQHRPVVIIPLAPVPFGATHDLSGPARPATPGD
ncbi:MAG: universal stress protein [Cryobacterium sp.]